MARNDAMKPAMNELAAKIVNVRNDLETTRLAVISLKVTVASILAKTTGTSVQDAYENLRLQEENLSGEIGSSAQILAIRSLLMSLTARFPEKSL